MNFRGTIAGVTTDDPKEWPALVKAAPKLERNENYGYNSNYSRSLNTKAARMGYQADQGMKDVLNSRLAVTLTQLEKEWLGADVTSDVLLGVWQVWSLHPENKYVWLVRDGESRAAHVDSLAKVGVES